MSALLNATGLGLDGRLARTDFRMEAAQLICLVGPNGSGKTSLLHALAGIGSPKGSVRIDGIDPSGRSSDERRRLLSYLPASREAAWPVTARDLVALGLPTNAGCEEAEAALASLDLGAMSKRRIDHMSTGERSRVLIARALAAKARLLLLDEPVANLDPYWQLILMERLRAIVSSECRGVVVALHDLDLAGLHADRLIIMNGGRITADGDPEALLGSRHISEIFRIERKAGAWRPVRPPADPRSSP